MTVEITECCRKVLLAAVEDVWVEIWLMDFPDFEVANKDQIVGMGSRQVMSMKVETQITLSLVD